MKFGKLNDIAKVDFTLPKDPVHNLNIFEKLTAAESATLYIGCTGWTMPQWKGTYYPSKLPAKDYLKYYSQQFNTIELNTTHYTIPSIKTVQRWKAESMDDFIFCPKVIKFISHTKQLGEGTDNIIRMIDHLSLLEEKLGPMFIQLPPYFGEDRLDILDRFLQRWPSHIPLSFELRHSSWYEDSKVLDNLSDLLLHYNQSLLVTDVAGRRDLLHMRLFGSYLMVRWVGNDLHKTDYSRIDEWVERISFYVRQGVKKVYFFSHEPDNILAPDIAAYLYCKFENISNVISRGPKRITGDKQLQLF